MASLSGSISTSQRLLYQSLMALRRRGYHGKRNSRGFRGAAPLRPSCRRCAFGVSPSGFAHAQINDVLSAMTGRHLQFVGNVKDVRRESFNAGKIVIHVDLHLFVISNLLSLIETFRFKDESNSFCWTFCQQGTKKPPTRRGFLGKFWVRGHHSQNPPGGISRRAAS